MLVDLAKDLDEPYNDVELDDVRCIVHSVDHRKVLLYPVPARI